MKRVVVTGLGIVSSIGNNKEEVKASLYNGTSGIEHSDEYEQMGFRSHVHGPVSIDQKAPIDRKLLRFMGDAAAFNYVAMKEAIEDSGLDEGIVSNINTGLITGSGGASTENTVLAADTMREKGIRRVGPYMVTKTMGSTTSACLSTAFKIKGTCYSISSACATSAHCIGNAYELIQMGKQDVMFAGGAEELHWTQSVLFDGMGALSSKYNDTPDKASRAYDADRDGFVISGGGGILVLEELEHAKKRGAKIYAEIVGYGATSDGYDMVQPSGEGATRCMNMALKNVEKPVNYLNTHGTSTPVGDTKELGAIQAAFADKQMPEYISSTKSLTGHALGAAGVNEAIYSLIMQENNFVCASANIDKLDPDAEGMPIALNRVDDVKLDVIMSNSFGFGGTNSTLVFQRYND